jgi:TetR/AcrR family transcriptional regulator, tetracycline repressor protein
MRPRQFDEDHVLDVALRLLDEGGNASLSVRSLAAELGVRPNAIYTYVADRSTLDAALAERVLALTDVALLDGAPAQWRRRIERFALATRAVLHTHPGAVPLLMSTPLRGPIALIIGEKLLEAFADAGLGRADASRASYALMVHLFGSVALDIAETDGRAPLAPEADRIAERAESVALIPKDVYPRTAASAATMAAWVGEAQFRWGITRLLDGIAPTKPG